MKIRKLILPLLTAFIIFGLLNGCSKKDDAQNINGLPAAPSVATVTVTDAAGGVTSTSANSGGTITSTGGANITDAGVCYSTGGGQPTITDNLASIGPAGTGSFVVALTGLTPNSIYSARAYATNSAGTSYGPRISFTTLP